MHPNSKTYFRHVRALKYKNKEYSTQEQISFLRDGYEKYGFTWSELGKMVGLPGNTLRRRAAKANINSRSRSEAQSHALKRGNAKHPTKGKERTRQEKLRIGKGVAKNWSKLDKEERRKRTEIGRKSWEDRPDKEAFIESGVRACQRASKVGSKLELYLLEELTRNKYEVQHHAVVLLNNRLIIDLLLPVEKIAIEVDGISHVEPVFGHETLEKNKRAEKEKNMFLEQSRYSLIRIKHMSSLSEVYKEWVLREVLKAIWKIKRSKEPLQITIDDKERTIDESDTTDARPKEIEKGRVD